MKTACLALLLACSLSFQDKIATTEDGKKVILKDDGTWVYADVQPEKKEKPDEYSDASKVIKEKCESDWPDDFRMRSYCEKQQKESVEKLKAGKPKDITGREYAIVHKKCTADWAKDYRMRQYCEEKQFEALRELRK